MVAPRSDPNLVRLLRTAGWLWLGYLFALVVVDRFLDRALTAIPVYIVVNGCTALAFLGLAYWDGLQDRLGRAYLPLALVLIAALPLVANHLMPGPGQGQASSPEGMALRLLPVLFVALVITAWQYDLPGVLLFSAGTGLLELLVVVLLAPAVVFLQVGRLLPGQIYVPIPIRTINIFAILTMVRTVAFVFVGLFISQLMGRLRAQQSSLEAANARLTHYASTLESLAVSRERNRLAHELHDTLAHSLTAIAVQLETVRAYWSLDRRRARAQLEAALSATRSGAEETRRALKALRASPLEQLGLGLALRQLAESAAARARLALEVQLPEPLPSLSPDVEQCLYRIAQEALENAVRHSNARRLLLRLTHSGTALTLTVQDDGSGFDATALTGKDHFGLEGMRERARLSGGELAVASRVGGGTAVTLTIGAAL